MVLRGRGRRTEISIRSWSLHGLFPGTKGIWFLLQRIEKQLIWGRILEPPQTRKIIIDLIRLFLSFVVVNHLRVLNTLKALTSMQCCQKIVITKTNVLCSRTWKGNKKISTKSHRLGFLIEKRSQEKHLKVLLCHI